MENIKMGLKEPDKSDVEVSLVTRVCQDMTRVETKWWRTETCFRTET